MLVATPGARSKFSEWSIYEYHFNNIKSAVWNFHCLWLLTVDKWIGRCDGQQCVQCSLRLATVAAAARVFLHVLLIQQYKHIVRLFLYQC